MTAKEFVKSHYPKATVERVAGRLMSPAYYLVRPKRAEMYMAEGKTASNAWVNAKKRIEAQLKEKQQADVENGLLYDRLSRVIAFGLKFDGANMCYVKDDICISAIEIKTLNDDAFDALIEKVNIEINRRESNDKEHSDLFSRLQSQLDSINARFNNGGIKKFDDYVRESRNVIGTYMSVCESKGWDCRDEYMKMRARNWELGSM